MKNLLLLLLTVCMVSCASLEQTGKRAAYETGNAIVANTVRKVQTGVTKKVEKTIDNIGKKKSEIDSTLKK